MGGKRRLRGSIGSKSTSQAGDLLRGRMPHYVFDTLFTLGPTHACRVGEPGMHGRVSFYCPNEVNFIGQANRGQTIAGGLNLLPKRGIVALGEIPRLGKSTEY